MLDAVVTIIKLSLEDLRYVNENPAIDLSNMWKENVIKISYVHYCKKQLIDSYLEMRQIEP